MGGFWSRGTDNDPTDDVVNSFGKNFVSSTSNEAGVVTSEVAWSPRSGTRNVGANPRIFTGRQNPRISCGSVRNEHIRNVGGTIERQNGNKRPYLTAFGSADNISGEIQPKKQNVGPEQTDRPTQGSRKFRTERGTAIHVQVTDITKLPVDVIVNAANESLRHNGGVARAIALAAGQELVTHSSDYIRCHGRIRTSHFAITLAGRLPCKKVLHAVGPRWNVRNQRVCREQLAATFQRIITYAYEEGLQSLAIPAISSGIYGAPADEVARAMVASLKKCVNKFETSDTSLQQIFLVDLVPSIVQLIVENLDEEAKNRTWLLDSKL